MQPAETLKPYAHGVRPYEEMDLPALAKLHTTPGITEYIVYVDGGCENNGKHNARAYGSYQVYRDDKDLVTAKMRFPLFACNTIKTKGRNTNNTAEAMAINMVLSWVLRSGVLLEENTIVKIRSDSELTIRQIRGEYVIKNQQLRQIAEERGNIMEKIRHRLGGANPWERIFFTKVSRSRIFDKLGH